jgi:hypothetical protein
VTLQYERGKLVARSRLEKVLIAFDLAREIDHNTVFLKTNLISSYSHSSLPKLSQLTALTHEPSDRRSNLATSQKNSTAYTSHYYHRPRKLRRSSKMAKVSGGRGGSHLWVPLIF